MNDYVACTVDGCSYLATAKDNMIMRDMFVNRHNWAASGMKRFHELAQKYYDIDDSTGYFLDLGANIGTTGIYFCKNLTPNLKLLAFEPDPENFKLLRINIILNDMRARTTLVRRGLGLEKNEIALHKHPTNPGANTLLNHFGDWAPTETVKIISLDSYLAKNKIAASEVKYIWIDTEGFEAQVLLGMKNLIKENPAPIFMECNLKAWDNSGHFDAMMALLAEGYSHFIHSWSGDKIYPLEELRTMERPNNALGQRGDIFLFKDKANK